VVIRQQGMFFFVFFIAESKSAYHLISIPLWRKCLGLLLPKPNVALCGLRDQILWWCCSTVQGTTAAGIGSACIQIILKKKE